MSDYRPHDWRHTASGKMRYGIEARIGKNGWMIVKDRGKPMIYDTAEERDKNLKEMQA